jgi:hypothetical protein
VLIGSLECAMTVLDTNVVGIVSPAIQTGLQQPQLPVAPGLADAVAAGDLGRALEMYPHGVAGALTHVARESQGRGLSSAFLIASAFAAFAAMGVYVLMRRVSRRNT